MESHRVLCTLLYFMAIFLRRAALALPKPFFFFFWVVALSPFSADGSSSPLSPSASVTTGESRGVLSRDFFPFLPFLPVDVGISSEGLLSAS